MSAPIQLGLFDDLQGASEDIVGPAPIDASLRELAEALSPNLHLGTSSWAFPGWAGLVYDCPADRSILARHGLRAYARHPLLRSVGLDRAFYAPLSVDVLAAYADQVPADFRFLVKAAAECTTPWRRGAAGRPTGPNEHYLEPNFAIESVVKPFVEGLGEKAGVLLFQFPPQGRAVNRDPLAFAARLGAFLAALPKGPVYAVELRDAGLVTDAYLEALAQTGVSHCICLHPRMPTLAYQAEAVRGLPPGPLIVRWVLHQGRQYEEARRLYAPFDRLVEPEPSVREALAGLCLDAIGAGSAVFVIANNKAEGSAPLTLQHLAARIAARSRNQERPE